MQSSELISVIIPVYNTALYLKKCVQSVLDQTYPYFEVILVDDGSTDSSPLLCDELAQGDSRIRVLHQKNGGLSNARNSGVRIATGECAVFIDSDDWIVPSLLQRLIDMQAGNPRVLCVAGIQPVLEDTVAGDPATPSPIEKLSPLGACSGMLYQTAFDTSACAKLVSLEIAREYPFPDGRLYEDLATVFKWILASEETCVTQDRLYCYLQRPGSIVRQGFSARQLDEKGAIDALYQFISGNAPSILDAAISRRFSCYCQLLLAMGLEASKYPQAASEIRAALKRDAGKVSRLKAARRKNRVAAMVYRVFGEFGLRASALLVRVFASRTDPNFALMK
jgi:glycosyltransferase involved in cell wall biosynthesis